MSWRMRAGMELGEVWLVMDYIPMSIFVPSDIMRAAESMIRDHGSGAAEKATEEAAKAGRQHRSTAAATWEKIAREIERLQAESSRGP